MSSAKLFVPAGGFAQANGGETFSPTQLALPWVLLACFFGIGVPSLKADDVSMNASAAFPGRLAEIDSKIIAMAGSSCAECCFVSMIFSPCRLFDLFHVDFACQAIDKVP